MGILAFKSDIYKKPSCPCGRVDNIQVFVVSRGIHVPVGVCCPEISQSHSSHLPCFPFKTTVSSWLYRDLHSTQMLALLSRRELSI